jgi:anti-sigma factor RsiW
VDIEDRIRESGDAAAPWRRICRGHRRACDDRISSLDLLIDDEILTSDRDEVLTHVEGCEGCRAYVDSALALRQAVRFTPTSCRPPGDFRARLADAIREAEIPPAPSAPRQPWVWKMSLAVACLVVAFAGIASGVFRTPRAPSSTSAAPAPPQVAGATAIRTPVLDEVVRWHRRQVPVEVAGPDAERVAAWFVGKMDFPVRAPRLRADAVLLGARLGNMQARDAALLIYEVDGTRLSVLIFEATHGAWMPGNLAASQVYVDNSSGYAVGLGHRDGTGYAFASELSSARFAQVVGASLE